jgi:polyisoprenoid-binding protein YceI
VPAYRLEYSVKPGENGQTLFEGKLTQSGVSPDFKMPVPLFAENAGRWERFAVVGIRGNTTHTFQVTLPSQPKKIRLNLNHDILTTGDDVSGLK